MDLGAHDVPGEAAATAASCAAAAAMGLWYLRSNSRLPIAPGSFGSDKLYVLPCYSRSCHARYIHLHL
jgi:3-polyprenyl-4-hydroxybenzoate decarboxylase